MVVVGWQLALAATVNLMRHLAVGLRLQAILLALGTICLLCAGVERPAARAVFVMEWYSSVHSVSVKSMLQDSGAPICGQTCCSYQKWLSH